MPRFVCFLRSLRCARRLLGLLGCALLLASAGPATATEEPRILVLFGYQRALPATIKVEQGLDETIAAGTDVSIEFLDSARFSGEAYVRAVTRFLRDKYAQRPPQVIVAGGEDALTFLLSHREALFPHAPIVHFGIRRSMLASLAPLPADVVGIPIEFDAVRTIDLALRLSPRAKRLVLVTGAAPWDRAWEARLRKEVTRFAGRVTPEFLAGLPTDELLERLRALDRDSIVFTSGYFRDGNGDDFIPVAAGAAMARAASVPVFAPSDTTMGTGIVGGYSPSYVVMGREVGRSVNALLDGVAPQALALPAVLPTTLNLDWNQIRRWRLDRDEIPEDAVIHFREPSFLEAHRDEAILFAVVMLLQSGLIVWLLVERRRRRVAEQAEQKQRFALVHASRVSVAGELTGSIAHEINQPLGAILSNTDAAELILGAGAGTDTEAESWPDPARHRELRAILADIRRDDLRASEVIRRLRALLGKQRTESTPLDLVEVAGEVVALLRVEARRRRMTLSLDSAVQHAIILGDRIQIQQVMIILVINAMDAIDAMDAGAADRRLVVMTLEARARGYRITVTDHGTGIAPEHLEQVFESFFSTKPDGMGLGLSIARTLVNTHHGRIWAENAAAGGARFQVELPALGGARGESRFNKEGASA
ncbi:histidine kinase [Thiocapsa marina 5811]|uniref:histidine kinase n=2 Tax=Thiocapsa marina TaxID=244573 RepID=F9UB95_9GAMM|nr:histidine kinase [Thiocapsa marina 5811]